ncbi:MAG TPA: ATP-dependent helicase [Syntrophorhabdaceae bacterium]|nr:ATP-dependent helicase [Syntrophorhabdaceae bacterium]
MISAELIFNGLNMAQREAVTASQGHLLVVAGPGAGKTLTIIRMIARLIHMGVSPDQIVAVTFTNRAAREMRERTETFLGTAAHGVFIGTLHMLGLKILRYHASSDFLIYARGEQEALIKKTFDMSLPASRTMAERISKVKNGIEKTDDEILGMVDRYDSALAQEHALDFDDLIVKPIALLTERSTSDICGGAFKYIIVDEYQDINPAEHRLIKLLSERGAWVHAIGDPDQAIYAFRGADVTNFLNFEEDFVNAKQIMFTDNYRSTATIVGASITVVRNNRRRIDRQINPLRETGSRIALMSLPDERAEGEFIVREIEARLGGTSHHSLRSTNPARDLGDGSYGFADFAIMYRTNARAAAIEEAFNDSGIPYQVIGARLTDRKRSMTDIISRLKDYVARTDDRASGELISATALVRKVLDEGPMIEGDDTGEYIKECAEFYDMTHTGKTPVNFVNELTLLTPPDDFDPRADAVTLMTMHMGKGLEFRTVFITGVEKGLLPYEMNGFCDDVEEERRLFYVGMTRAKDELFLTYARSRTIFGKKDVRSPSPFLNEIPEEYIDARIMPDRRKKQEGKQLELF